MRLFCALFTGVVLALLIGGAVYLFSGSYNIAATEPHWKVIAELIEEVRDRSVTAHSKGIVTPELKDITAQDEGLITFHEMCRLCHGAPGQKQESFAKGLYPHPPKLAAGHVQREATDAEIFWIAKNGLKLTGMPAFGPTHTDEQLWGIVAVVRRLPDMKPEEYAAKVKGSEGHLDQGAQ